MSQFHEAGQPVPGCYPASASGAQRAIQAHRAILPIQTADVSPEGLDSPLWSILDRVHTILDKPDTELPLGARFVATVIGLAARSILADSIAEKKKATKIQKLLELNGHINDSTR